MHPALSPIREVISGTADLEYVNRRLIAAGFIDLKVDAVAARQRQLVSPMTPSPSPQSSKIFNFEQQSKIQASASIPPEKSGPQSRAFVQSSNTERVEIEALHQISPDSDVPCDSPDCPIKDVSHNLGRYFHKGEQAPKDLDDSDFQSPNGCRLASIRGTFNFTMPPPNVVAAYIRIHEYKASQDDKDKVRQYQKHHMWSPINSEPSTPTPRRPNSELQVVYAHVLPLKHSSNSKSGDRYEAMRDAIVNMAKIADDRSSDEVGSSPIRARALSAADFGNSDIDDDDWVSMDSDINRFPVELSNIRNDNIDTDQDSNEEALSEPPRAKKEVPQGTELAAVQFGLQEKILGQIADEALEREREGVDDSVDGGIDGFRPFWLE